MKRNVLLLGVVLIGLLAFMAGCDSGSSTGSSTQKQPETLVAKQSGPPASFMNKTFIVDGMMDVVKSSFMNRMQIDEASIDKALSEFTLQTFIDGKSLEQQGMKVNDWVKDPAGWKLNFEDPDQQKSAHLVFEAGYNGEVKVKEFVFGGNPLPQDNVARVYAAGFGAFLESKGFKKKG